MTSIRWGVLGVARIAAEKVIPAMQAGEHCSIEAIASRDPARAAAAATALDIPRSYGSYQELLDDRAIDAIYNPLPNHLHVPWTVRALEAGKHVLCEKPIALTAAEAETLLDVRDRTGRQVQEAFMVRHHPQWKRVREIISSGRLGQVRAVQGVFAYSNHDPLDIRNQQETGGGGVYDIGCYPTVISRFVFASEPTRVNALLELDPTFGTDRLASAILEFPAGQASFICSTQVARHQSLIVLGAEAWLRVEFPFVMEPDRACRLFIGGGSYPGPVPDEIVEIPPVDQYTSQGEDFAACLLEGRPIPYPIEDAIANMRVLDALFESSRSGKWENVAPT